MRRRADAATAALTAEGIATWQVGVVRDDARPEGDGLLLSGDVLFAGSIGRSDLAGGDPASARSGLVLDDPAAIEAMEPGEVKHFLPVKVKLGKGTEDYDYSGQLAKLEDFGALSRYIDDTLRSMAEELRAGSVETDPWFESFRSNACVNCEFAGACLFDETVGGWRLRETLKTEEAWEKIRGNEHE